MTLFPKIKISFFIVLLGLIFIPTHSFAAKLTIIPNEQVYGAVTSEVFEKAKKNDNWKLAFLTGKNTQVVFMNVSPTTNPRNEIGFETHKFDQVIFIVQGNGIARLNGRFFEIKPGDMIFIPQGVSHNVSNLDKKVPLKIISVYSATDIPANAVYKTMADVPRE